MLTHTVPPYFIHPDHPVTIIVVGLGGTGSILLTKLAKINTTLKALGHKGIQVIAFDGDKVSKSNEGRSNFFPNDVGKNKATVLIERINRACGFGWMAMPMMYPPKSDGKIPMTANIVITCTDTVKARRTVYSYLKKSKKKIKGDIANPLNVAYWMDIGNNRSNGQVILGTMGTHNQPKNLDGAIHYLPNVFDLYPNLEKHEEPDQPSCSTAEAIAKQDLFINDTLATWAGDLVWDMLRKFRLSFVGCYVNLDTKSTNGIPVRVPLMKWFPKPKKETPLKEQRGLVALLENGQLGQEVELTI